MTEPEIKLKCPQCKVKLSYLIVRTMFYIGRKDGLPHYQTGTEYNCPFCGNGIAGDEALAIDRLKTGRFGMTTKQFERLRKKNAKKQNI